MGEDEDAGRLRRRTTTQKRWEHSGADRQVVRRTVTTHRVYSKTTTVEEFVGEPQERPVDYQSALSVSPPMPMVADSGGRPHISSEVMNQKARELRSYWALKLGKRPHEKFETRLKPMILEFGLETMKCLIDKAAAELPPDASPSDASEMLFSLMSQARYDERAQKEGKP